ncbi:MAG: tyrosine-type recombinase/integrase, partial [Acidobacteria bacterium]|nr:tyrosine-type recombinase/integrase [Acidobacteriota bacterium]
SGRNLTGVSRARKLAAIRKFFAFLHENGSLQTNPAAAVKGARREEKEPAILYKEQYKALLYEASESPRDYAIIMTFLQTGIRLSELARMRLEDIDSRTGCSLSGRARGGRTGRSRLSMRGSRLFGIIFATGQPSSFWTTRHCSWPRTARHSTSPPSRRLLPSTSRRPGSANGSASIR